MTSRKHTPGMEWRNGDCWMHVKPAVPGNMVPDPDAPQDSSAASRLPEDGRLVPVTGAGSNYWRMRIRHGDVVMPEGVSLPQQRPPKTPEELRKYGGGDLRGTVLEGRDLRGTRLEYADLRGPDTSFRRADLLGVGLLHADLRRCTLTDAVLCDATLAGSKLGGADLRGAALTGTDLQHVSWVDSGTGGCAKLDGARLDSSTRLGVGADGTTIFDAEWECLRWVDAIGGERTVWRTPRAAREGASALVADAAPHDALTHVADDCSYTREVAQSLHMSADQIEMLKAIRLAGEESKRILYEHGERSLRACGSAGIRLTDPSEVMRVYDRARRGRPKKGQKRSELKIEAEKLVEKHPGLSTKAYRSKLLKTRGWKKDEDERGRPGLRSPKKKFYGDGSVEKVFSEARRRK